MHPIHIISLESIHYGGDRIGNDLWMRFTLEGHRTVNGHATPVKPAPIELHPKFDKETAMASHLPITLYQLPLGNPKGVFESDVFECKIHVLIVEKDKFSDHGHRTSHVIKMDRLAIQPHPFELEVHVKSHGGDKGKTAVFHCRFLSQAVESVGA
jgi:hypothetical protein